MRADVGVLVSFCRETKKVASNQGTFQVPLRRFLLHGTYDVCHICNMHSTSESPADVLRWFQNRAADLSPAALGSLNFRRCPCVREHCQACQTGEQHPSYVLYSRVKGRRFTLYVPEELVPEVRRCLENGRALQELLQEVASRYLQALKRQRTKAQEKA